MKKIISHIHFLHSVLIAVIMYEIEQKNLKRARSYACSCVRSV